jgi:predicted Rossmann fold nucleotide-binding protein DprA/Smf involved in DNA uptake
MSENDNKKGKDKKPIQILRERRGGVPKLLVERNREQTRIRKKLAEALRDGPRTVPEIAKATDIPTHEAFWYLIGMKKYGKVIEGRERDGYYEYALKGEED